MFRKPLSLSLGGHILCIGYSLIVASFLSFALRELHITFMPPLFISGFVFVAYRFSLEFIFTQFFPHLKREANEDVKANTIEAYAYIVTGLLFFEVIADLTFDVVDVSYLENFVVYILWVIYVVVYHYPYIFRKLFTKVMGENEDFKVEKKYIYSFFSHLTILGHLVYFGFIFVMFSLSNYLIALYFPQNIGVRVVFSVIRFMLILYSFRCLFKVHIPFLMDKKEDLSDEKIELTLEGIVLAFCIWAGLVFFFGIYLRRYYGAGYRLSIMWLHYFFFTQGLPLLKRLFPFLIEK